VSHAEERVPRHADYPAAVFTGPPAAVQLDTDFKRSMKTRLRNGAQAQPNFAGSYHIVTWGCGTNCLIGLVVDRRTGKVYGLPKDPADLQLFDLWHRANSRLLVATNLTGPTTAAIALTPLAGSSTSSTGASSRSSRPWSGPTSDGPCPSRSPLPSGPSASS
jgi:hypothetical protein